MVTAVVCRERKRFTVSILANRCVSTPRRQMAPRMHPTDHVAGQQRNQGEGGEEAVMAKQSESSSRLPGRQYRPENPPVTEGALSGNRPSSHEGQAVRRRFNRSDQEPFEFSAERTRWQSLEFKGGEIFHAVFTSADARSQSGGRSVSSIGRCITTLGRSNRVGGRVG